MNGNKKEKKKNRKILLTWFDFFASHFYYFIHKINSLAADRNELQIFSLLNDNVIQT